MLLTNIVDSHETTAVEVKNEKAKTYVKDSFLGFHAQEYLLPFYHPHMRGR